MKKNTVFIAATGQNVGKTTLCLGLIAALKKRFDSVGFIKPVGQRHVPVQEGLNVDKDAVLFKNHFKLRSSWQHVSPVIIPAGFTRKFLDQEVTEDKLMAQITQAFDTVYHEHAYTIVEGTGHVGVGSIVNLNNAKIAAKLGTEMVIIASAGLGSAFDELALNVAMCRHYGVTVRGVILNRVMEEKRAMLLEYFPKTLKSWGVPLIGLVPYNELLSSPTMLDFETLFGTDILSGQDYHYRTFKEVKLVAGSLAAYEPEIVSDQLIITPASREDIIMRTIKEHEQLATEGKNFRGGMILTGQQPPSDFLLEQIARVDLPILYAPICSYDAMKMITSFIAKIRMEDTPKIEMAKELVEKNINFDLLCNN